MSYDVAVEITKPLPQGEYRVIVTSDDDSVSTHTVTVDVAYMKSLGYTDAVSLLEDSFAFLLAREQKEAILRTFDLHDISRYFSEYESTIRHT